MQLPLPTTELLSYLPHKPPMVWVDEVVSITDKEFVCRTNLNPESHYFGKEGLRPSSFIEFMAQGYAFASIAKQLNEKNDKTVGKAFLVGVTQAKFAKQEELPKTGHITIKLETEREMLPVILFKGVILDSNQKQLAEAKLKVFAAE